MVSLSLISGNNSDLARNKFLGRHNYEQDNTFMSNTNIGAHDSSLHSHNMQHNTTVCNILVTNHNHQSPQSSTPTNHSTSAPPLPKIPPPPLITDENGRKHLAPVPQFVMRNHHHRNKLLVNCGTNVTTSEPNHKLARPYSAQCTSDHRHRREVTNSLNNWNATNNLINHKRAISMYHQHNQAPVRHYERNHSLAANRTRSSHFSSSVLSNVLSRHSATATDPCTGTQTRRSVSHYELHEHSRQPSPLSRTRTSTPTGLGREAPLVSMHFDSNGSLNEDVVSASGPSSTTSSNTPRSAVTKTYSASYASHASLFRVTISQNTLQQSVLRPQLSMESSATPNSNSVSGSGSGASRTSGGVRVALSKAATTSGESILRRLRLVRTQSSTIEEDKTHDSKVTADHVASTSTGGLATIGLSSDKADPSSSKAPPSAPKTVACHDCASLAGLWNISKRNTSLEPPRLTGASQAQSPTEDDPGDGKANLLVLNCPAFRNELGGEPTRRLALCRHTVGAATLPNHSNNNKLQTWHREVSATEAGVLENLSNVYLGGRLCAYRQNQIVIEPMDPAHHNYFGTEPEYGPVAVSVVREKIAPAEAKEAGLKRNAIYRMIIRLGDQHTLRVTVPEDAILSELSKEALLGSFEQTGSKPENKSSSRTILRELLELVCPSLQVTCLRLAIPVPETEELLLKLDEQMIYTKYKFGVLLCKAGQSTEEDMYNNEFSTPGLDEFLEMMGTRVRLKAFDGYKAGLDTRGDTTGTHSYYTTFQQQEIMLHVGTMLPFTSNKQQLARKRHIGNDIVTIIFQEPGAGSFSPMTVRSHFQHVFIVIRVNNPCTDQVSYQVAVCRAKDVPVFGPPIPGQALFTKSKEFRDFILTKMINSENAVHRSTKFAAMSARTRRDVLKDLVENHSTQHHVVEPTRISSKFGLGSSAKRKERVAVQPVLSECVRGALSWGHVLAEDYSRGTTVSVILGLSADSLVMMQRDTGDVIFATPTHSLIGWHVVDRSIRIYHDHGAVLVCRLPDRLEVDQLVERLMAVTRGSEAHEMTIRRNAKGHYDFQIQEEGIITEVGMYSMSWQSGLRQGSRIVEIGGAAVATLTQYQMHDLLKHAQSIKTLVISPSADGTPRRGCEDPQCTAIVGESSKSSASTSAVHIGRTPPSYHEILAARRQRESPSGRTDLGYESGTWTSTAQEFLERRKTMPDWNIAGVFGDTLSSSGSASSEVSAATDTVSGTAQSDKRTLRGVHDVKRTDSKRNANRAQQYKYRSEPDIAVENNSSNGPPLPPKTYKPRKSNVISDAQSPSDSTLHEQHDSLERTHSDEFLAKAIDLLDTTQAECAHSARDQDTGREQYEWNSNVVEAAARVLASNPTVASCQLRLQAALGRVKTLEYENDRLVSDLENERTARQDLVAEVVALREDRQRLETERNRAENELKRFTSWVCNAAVDVTTSSVADV